MGGSRGHLTQQFADLVRRAEPEVPLDRAALLISAHARPSLDVEDAIAQLDELADTCPAPTFRAWRRHLFEDHGFHGDVEDYYDPRNSFLDEVLRRGVGLPITLSVLGLEVGRRLGLRLAGVGLPGHFLLRDLEAVPATWVDPFAGGDLLDRAGCEARFRRIHGHAAPFVDAYLEPVGTWAILSRMLANLKGIYTRRGDLDALEWVLQLRVAVPGAPTLEHRDHARVLGARGRFAEAAEQLEALADSLGDGAPSLRAEAAALRARLN